MKMKRSKKNYGSGGGTCIYESDLFTVILWDSQGGQNTRLTNSLLLSLDLIFDGSHDFTSDEQCIAQYEPKEILEMLKFQKESGIKIGEKNKILEFHKFLTI